MTQINPHYLKLRSGYLFPEIGRRVREFATKNPEAKLVRLGIGDVVLPLPQAVREAIKRAVDEMGQAEGFHGYGPEQGYEFLRDTIVTNDFEARGSDIQADEIFISDGSKCDTGNIQEIFDTKSIVAVTDPVYPVYVDTNVMAGRTGAAAKNGHYRGLVYLPLNVGNNFAPEMPRERVDLVYLCSPNNPTGTAMTRAALEQWVRYAKKVKAILLFDAAYEAFITEPDIPHSIFEIEGAREVAIEFRSFSKNAGFTGTRCAYTVVPKDLFAFDRKNEVVSVHHLWMRRHTTKFNGVAYPIQRGAEAVYSEAGKKEVRDLVSYYLANAAITCEGLRKAGLQVYGGVNAPYVWVKTPGKFTSWDFFDWLLKETNVVVTPGSGFGPTGEGYFRVSAFGFRENIEEAVRRIQSKLPNICT